MKFEIKIKKVRFLYQEGREYRGNPGVRNNITLAKRIVRRTVRQQLKHQRTEGSDE